MRAATGLPILTDVHEPAQVAAVADVADVIQIPAFLCRQTELLAAVGRAGRSVNVKKGQWMSAEAMAGAVEKVRAGGAPEVAVTERGTFFGYGDLVVDMRNFARLRAACEVPVIFDATHSVQQPGQGPGGASGGLREFIPPLLYAAAAAGADGFFLETHPDPDRALSDGPNMVPLDQLPGLLTVALDIWQRAREVVRACEADVEKALDALGGITDSNRQAKQLGMKLVQRLYDHEEQLGLVTTLFLDKCCAALQQAADAAERTGDHLRLIFPPA